jgi:MFS family permease
VTSAFRVRLFLTCWIVYSLHFATDFVREHYLVLSMVEDHSYRLDKYMGMHVDIFENPPHATEPGAHHGANPGMSMVAAIPYFVFRPAVDLVVNRELAARKAAGDTGTAVYNDPRPRRVEFYKKTRALGLDVRFGLVALLTTVFCMAPITAASVVLMFALLEAMGIGRRSATLLALLFAFGTPVFFRTAYLNQNLGLGLFTFLGFALLWNPSNFVPWTARRRNLVAGLLGGLAFLSDYSGAILMGLIGFYAWWRNADEAGVAGGFKQSLWYALGCVPGVLLLWQYQYASFGNPFLPPQHWMAPVEWIDVGYQGVGGFSAELFKLLLIEPRYGLFIAMPVAVLALATPFLTWRDDRVLPRREALTALLLSLSLIVFFATVQYTRLQWVTGIRYLAAIFPFVFLAVVPVLLALPRVLFYGIGILSLTVSWSLAMVRSQGTVAENVVRVFVEGFQLPSVTVLTKMSAQYLPWFRGTVSPLPFFVVTAAVIWVIWAVPHPWRRLDSAN